MVDSRKSSRVIVFIGELNQLLFLPQAIVPRKNKVVQTCVCFLKMNEISLSLQVKQWTIFIGSGKILAPK